MSSVHIEGTQLQFFEAQFGQATGWLEIACRGYNSKRFEQKFFRWPDDAPEIIDYIQNKTAGNDVWFGTSLFAEPRRSKDNVTECWTLWADLDTCDWQLTDPKPTIVVESSPGRYQAIWCLDTAIAPGVAEELSQRIAKSPTLADNGADPSGWDLGQLLRVPFTRNYKYVGEPEVELKVCLPLKCKIELFADLPPVAGARTNLKLEAPDASELSDPDDILINYRLKLDESFWTLYQGQPSPDADWSKLFFRMCNLLLEAGLTLEEVYAVALHADCNKFNRDEKDVSYTWADVTRIHSLYTLNALNRVGRSWAFPALVSEANIPTDETFVERYIEWATSQTDAPREYAEASAFIILSSLLSSTVRIHTSIGTIFPNLWVMITADTTLTRKTTSMDLALALLDDVVEDIILATDGSVEGLLQGLSFRPGRASLFKRDEFTGLMDQMVRKDYMSGMLEMFTQLYDGKNIKRLLKKETIEVRQPVFILFAGGIKNRLQSILTHEHVASGFIPRFLVVSAESSMQNWRPMGPRSQDGVQGRAKLVHELITYRQQYVDDIPIKADDGSMIVMSAPEIEAHLSDEAWVVYNDIEKQLVEAGITADMKEYMTPVFDRMAKSVLKMAALLAAVRQIPEHGIIRVEPEDIYRAASYIQRWAVHMLDLIGNLGQTANERMLQTVLHFVQKNKGVMRSDVMRHFRISAMEMHAIISTLEQRDLVRLTTQGKAIYLWPT